jgi:type IV pilus assembly protein PilE
MSQLPQQLPHQFHQRLQRRFPCTFLRSFPQGFTLIESMASLALLAILMAIALPSLTQHWQHVRRQDAQNALRQLHLRQTQWRGLHPQFASTLPELGWPQTTSSSGFYQLAVQNATAQSYQLHATAIGVQTQDTACKVMSLQWTADGTLLRTSNLADNTDVGRCWTW